MAVSVVEDGAETGFSPGAVWRCLSDHGRVSLSRLVKDLDESRDRAMQAVGWLARENKITFDQNGCGRLTRLK